MRFGCGSGIGRVRRVPLGDKEYLGGNGGFGFFCFFGKLEFVLLINFSNKLFKVCLIKFILEF